MPDWGMTCKKELGVLRHQLTQIQYDLLKVLYDCKMALLTLYFSQVKPTIAMLRERRARAPEAVWARFPWCDRKARCACFAVTHLRW